MGHLSEYIAQHGSPTKGMKFSQWPLRKIVEVIRHANGLFDKSRVVFECGHEGSATANAVRGRCKKCEKK